MSCGSCTSSSVRATRPPRATTCSGPTCAWPASTWPAAWLPRDPEVMGLLALLLLTDARRAARTDDAGDLVLLEEQDRTRWDPDMIADGEGILVEALRRRQPGPYQLWAAIAACHSTAASAAATDWRQISVLYRELLKYDPSPVTEANRAIAVARGEGPAAGLSILDVV